MKFCTTILLLLSITCFSQQHYPIKNMLGVNAHQWDIWYYGFDPYAGSWDAKYKALIDLHPSSIRIYMDADLTQDSSGNYAFNPTYRGGFEPETGIKRIKASNPEIFIQACYQRQTITNHKDWEASSGVWNSPLNFPYKYNNPTDRLKPSSYSNMGHDLAVMTIRGGRNANAPDYMVHRDSSFVNGSWQYYTWNDNYMIKGQNFWDAVEGGNEWDWWWDDRNHNLNSYELAAAWKGMYDSVKKIDVSMMFTNGGIAWDRPDTFLKAIDWWTKNGYQIPADYFSFHCYPDAENLYGIWQVMGGLNPESYMAMRAKNMVDAVGQYKPIVVGEWGYDVHPESVCNAPAFSTYTAEQTRAYWSARTVLKFAQYGIYRAQWYRAYQDQPNSSSDNNAGMFATMALLRQYNNGGTIIKRTLVGDFFKQVQQFGDYVFTSSVRDDSIQHLKFNQNAKEVQSLWSVETYKVVNGRPVYTERKIKYNLPAGTVYGFNEDSSGAMYSYHRNTGDTALTSKPFFFVADLTALAIRDREPLPPRPFHPPLYTVELYELYGTPGRLIMKKQKADIQEFKAKIPRKHYYILKYYNDKTNQTEKIYKQ